MNDLEAELEAAFEIALVQQMALRALVDVSDRGVVSHSWKLGYLAGRLGRVLEEARGLKESRHAS